MRSSLELLSCLALFCSPAVAGGGTEILLADNGPGTLVDVIPRLTGLGHTVTLSNPSLWTSGFDYAPYDVVAFENSSPSPADIGHLVAAVDAGQVGVVFFRGSPNEATAVALGLIGGGALGWQTPTDLDVLDNTHWITANLSLGVQNLGYTYMSYASNPVAGATILASGPSGAALVVHDTRRVVLTPFYGHSANYANETAAGREITDRSVLWAAGADAIGTSYCTAGTSASGCQPALSASGSPSATAASGFLLQCANVEGAKDGLFFTGTNGRQANPWGNGTSYQCVVPPVKRLGLLNGGGANGACDGNFSLDLNALWCPTCPRPAKNPGAGALVQAQLWYRDPLNTSNRTTSLSDALEFLVGP